MKMNISQQINFTRLVGAVIATLLLTAHAASAQTTSFTYQGRLTEAGATATGSYEMQFRLFDAATGDNQAGPTLSFDRTTTNPGPVAVTNGVFSVQLDFGANAFPGPDRYLEISVKRSGETSFTPLRPRQQLAPTPYAVRALSAAAADTANNAKQLGSVAASQYVQTDDSRLSDPRPPKPNSADYIQNTTSPQSLSNFNIDGDGTVGGTISGNAVNAVTQYNINGSRVLSAAGFSNLFAGFSAGASNVTGQNNSYFGVNAGQYGMAGNSNSFFGARAGQNSSGSLNSYFGEFAGWNNSGTGNSLFGRSAGWHSTGDYNSFIGMSAGAKTSGDYNSFVGVNAGQNNMEGHDNSFFGLNAGSGNTIGNFNTLLGSNADVGANNLDHATAIGANATVSSSNRIVLGRSNGLDTVEVPGAFKANTVSADSTNNLVFDGQSSADIGTWMQLANRSAGGHNWAVISSGSAKGENAGQLLFNDQTSVRTPLQLDANGATISGTIAFTTLGSMGSTPLCWNPTTHQIAICGSSLRYKTNIAPFSSGLSFVRRLRPISFDWKNGGPRDVGFGAEEVAALNPLFVNYNSKGQVEGVKYDRLSVAFVNAFKEQQAQIEQQRDQLKQQQNQIGALKKLVCLDHPKSKVCR